MSSIALYAAMSIRGMTPLSKLTLILLGEHAHPSTHVSNVSIIEACEWLGCCSEQLFSSLEEISSVIDVQIEYFPSYIEAKFGFGKKSVNHVDVGPKQMYIYVMSGDDAVKIGISKNCKARLQSLQENLHTKLKLEFFYKGTERHIREAERFAHLMLSQKMNIRSKTGVEWFHIDVSTAIEIVKHSLDHFGLGDEA